MSKNAEDDTDKLVHDGAADGELCKFWTTGFDLLDPEFDGPAAASGNRCWHEERFAQEGVTNFRESGLAFKTAGLIFFRIEPRVESELVSGLKLFAGELRENFSRRATSDSRNRAKQFSLSTKNRIQINKLFNDGIEIFDPGFEFMEALLSLLEQHPMDFDG